VARTISIAVRFDDLTGVQRSQTLPFGIDDEAAIAEVAAALLESVPLCGPVRLFSLHASSLVDRGRNEVQLSFGIGADQGGRRGAVEQSRGLQVDNAALRDTLDEIRQRYGAASVGVASELRGEGIDIARQRGRNVFGPTATPEP
jgi:hypothetical protein